MNVERQIQIHVQVKEKLLIFFQCSEIKVYGDLRKGSIFLCICDGK